MFVYIVGLLSYSMPQGDKRGPTYEFYDWNYDGEWRGNYLENGLGSLTDGNLGPDDYKLSYYAKSKLCFEEISFRNLTSVHRSNHFFQIGIQNYCLAF